MPNPEYTILSLGAIGAVLSTIPFGITALEYRHRDNGLSYILLVSGTAVWNGMFAAQLLGPDLRVKEFFFSLALVGSLLTGLGWFLFASTASRTSFVLDNRLVYGVIAVISGIDITFVVTSPVHSVYWHLPEAMSRSDGFAVITPQIGYWLHIGFLASLFVAGTLLFAGAWESQQGLPYTPAYTVAGFGIVIVLVGSAILVPGGLSLAPPLVVSLTAIGWLQAKQTRVLESVRAAFRPR